MPQSPPPDNVPNTQKAYSYDNPYGHKVDQAPEKVPPRIRMPLTEDQAPTHGQNRDQQNPSPRLQNLQNSIKSPSQMPTHETDETMSPMPMPVPRAFSAFAHNRGRRSLEPRLAPRTGRRADARALANVATRSLEAVEEARQELAATTEEIQAKMQEQIDNMPDAIRNARLDPRLALSKRLDHLRPNAAGNISPARSRTHSTTTRMKPDPRTQSDLQGFEDDTPIPGYDEDAGYTPTSQGSGRRQSFSDADLRHVVNAANEHKDGPRGMEWVATELGVRPSSVRRRCRRFNPPLKILSFNLNSRGDRAQKVFLSYKGKRTLAEVGIVYGISQSSVRNDLQWHLARLPQIISGIYPKPKSIHEIKLLNLFIDEPTQFGASENDIAALCDVRPIHVRKYMDRIEATIAFQSAMGEARDARKVQSDTYIP